MRSSLDAVLGRSSESVVPRLDKGQLLRDVVYGESDWRAAAEGARRIAAGDVSAETVGRTLGRGALGVAGVLGGAFDAVAVAKALGGVAAGGAAAYGLARGVRRVRGADDPVVSLGRLGLSSQDDLVGFAEDVPRIRELAVAPEGGFTWNPRTRNYDSFEGFGVSVFPDRELQVPVSALVDEDVSRYVGRNLDVLEKDPDLMVGGWRDRPIDPVSRQEVDGEDVVFLDLTRLRPTLEDAVRTAIEKKQKGIFSYQTFQTLRTPESMEDFYRLVEQGEYVAEGVFPSGGSVSKSLADEAEKFTPILEMPEHPQITRAYDELARGSREEGDSWAVRSKTVAWHIEKASERARVEGGRIGADAKVFGPGKPYLKRTAIYNLTPENVLLPFGSGTDDTLDILTLDTLTRPVGMRLGSRIYLVDDVIAGMIPTQDLDDFVRKFAARHQEYLPRSIETGEIMPTPTTIVAISGNEKVDSTFGTILGVATSESLTLYPMNSLGYVTGSYGMTTADELFYALGDETDVIRYLLDNGTFIHETGHEVMSGLNFLLRESELLRSLAPDANPMSIFQSAGIRGLSDYETALRDFIRTEGGRFFGVPSRTPFSSGLPDALQADEALEIRFDIQRELKKAFPGATEIPSLEFSDFTGYRMYEKTPSFTGGYPTAYGATSPAEAAAELWRFMGEGADGLPLMRIAGQNVGTMDLFPNSVRYIEDLLNRAGYTNPFNLPGV